MLTLSIVFSRRYRGSAPPRRASPPTQHSGNPLAGVLSRSPGKRRPCLMMNFEGYSVKAEKRWRIASKRPYVAPGSAIRGEGRPFPNSPTGEPT